MAKIRVYIGFDDLHSRQALDLTTNREGEVQFDTNGAKTLQVSAVGTVSCGEQRIGMPMRDYSIRQILRMGLVTENDCGNPNPESMRGKLLYFARPATWSELFKN
jgi:hypothetical protein